MTRAFTKFRYSDPGTPDTYCCDKCKARGVRLWREYQTIASKTDLLCARCAAEKMEIDQKRDLHSYIDGRHDSISWMIPAVPCEDDDTFWGYTSVPEEGVRWWQRLGCTLPESAAKYNARKGLAVS